MNKLREKFSKARTDTQFDSGVKFEEQCEQITDDFSVKFFHWMHTEEAEMQIEKLDTLQSDIELTTELQKYFKENIYEA